MKIDAKNEASDEHIEKVCQLTISDVMELSNNNLIPKNLLVRLFKCMKVPVNFSFLI